MGDVVLMVNIVSLTDRLPWESHKRIVMLIRSASRSSPKTLEAEADMIGLIRSTRDAISTS
jgi:hypothetical protein